MVGSVNKVILVGNVGKDPDIRKTADGKKIASFTLATSDVWKDKMTGERKDRTEWHRVVVFNDGLVNIIESYVHKGTRLYLEGSLQTRKWNDNSGVEKYTTEIVLQGFNCTLTILDSKQSSSNHYDDSSSKHNNDYDHSMDLDDQIPF